MKPFLSCLLEELLEAQTLPSFGRVTQTSLALSMHPAACTDDLQILSLTRSLC